MTVKQTKEFWELEPISFTVGEHHTFRMDASEDEAKKKADEEAAKKAADDAAKKAADEAAAKKAEDERLAKMNENERKLLQEVMERKDREKKLKEQLDTLSSGKTELETKLKQFEGIDPVKVRDLLAAQKTEEEKALEAKGEWDRLKERMNAEHQAELKKVQDELEATKGTIGQLQGTIGDITVGSAFRGSEFIRKELVLTPDKARTVYGSHFEVVDGSVIAYDKPKGAKERTQLIDGTGQPLPFDAAISKLVDADADKDSLLRSKLAPGIGSGDGGNKANGFGSQRQVNNSELTGRARIAEALKAKPLQAKVV